MSKKRRPQDEFVNPNKVPIFWQSKDDRRHLLNKSNLTKRYNSYDGTGQRTNRAE